MDLETAIGSVFALLTGGSVAGAMHAGRAAVRPASTAGTAGVGNPALSVAEDGVSGVLTGLALLIPILAFLAVIAVLVGLVVAWRRIRSWLPPAPDSRRRAGSEAGPGP